MAGKHKSWILPGIVGLTCGLFALDLFMPLGVAIGALYAGIVLLASFSPNPQLPLLTAACATGLLIVGAVAGPRLSSIPLWVGVTNASLGLVVVWISAVLLQQRHHAEIRLRQAKDELEARVAARTRELADVNRTLLHEISEHVETEESLRASEHDLATSRQVPQLLPAGGKIVFAGAQGFFRLDVFRDFTQQGVVHVGQFPGAGGDTRFKFVCLLYTSPSPRDRTRSRMPSSA